MHREAKRVTREAKEEWFLKKAEEAQAGRHGGKVIGRCIRHIQGVRQGLVPIKCEVCVMRRERTVTHHLNNKRDGGDASHRSSASTAKLMQVRLRRLTM